MTDYIKGIELRDKTVLIKRKSNCKWYPLFDILTKIKEGYNIAEQEALRLQFYSEYKEIEKICFMFGVIIPNKYKCIKNKTNFAKNKKISSINIL